MTNELTCKQKTTPTLVQIMLAINLCELTLFTVASHEACATGALPGDVVAVSSITTLADL